MTAFIREKTDNYRLVKKNFEDRSSEVEGYPFWLTLDPASLCNLRCPLCPTGQGRQTRPAVKMDMQIYRRILSEIGPYIIHMDLCNWGEPLMNENICEMISIAKEYGIHVKLDTNLNRMEKDMAHDLIASGLDKIILSIDGADQDSYGKYRVGGDFQAVIENAAELIRERKKRNVAKPVIEWQYLVFRHNQDDMDKARKIAESLGVDCINFTPPYAGSTEWLTTKEPFCSQFYEVKDGKVDFKKPPANSVCNWLWDAIAVNADGSVSPCCSVENAEDDFAEMFPFGHFKEFFNSKKFRDARRHVAADPGGMISGSDNICERCGHCGWSNHMDVEHIFRSMKEDENGKR